LNLQEHHLVVLLQVQQRIQISVHFSPLSVACSIVRD